MAAVFTYEGIQDKVNYLLGISLYYGWDLCLFVNNVTPDWTTVVGDLTECAVPGYSPQVFVPGNWAFSVDHGTIICDQPPLTFRFLTPAFPTTVYGYFVRNRITGKTVCAGRIGVPYLIPDTGGILVIRFEFVDGNCFCPGMNLIIPGGGLALGGDVDFEFGHVLSPGGGLALGGDVDFEFMPAIGPDGGVAFGGDVDFLLHPLVMPDGGVAFGGDAL